KVADKLPEDSELKELFYPIMCFFQNTNPTVDEKNVVAENAVNPEFDMPVLAILESFI
ncbi:MAG: hypothetical protein JWR50_4079, partial [Mucilaginibacter sp.]|nr:hypothetical protein [Mucilaginibacter sp.]